MVDYGLDIINVYLQNQEEVHNKFQHVVSLCKSKDETIAELELFKKETLNDNADLIKAIDGWVESAETAAIVTGTAIGFLLRFT